MQHFSNSFIQILDPSAKGAKMVGGGGEFQMVAPSYFPRLWIWRTLLAPSLWHINRMVSQNYFTWQKKFNSIKLVNIWIKYKLIRSLKTTCDKLRQKFKYGWWRHPPIPPIFSHRFKRFTKLTFVRSGGDCFPQSPMAPPLVYAK